MSEVLLFTGQKGQAMSEKKVDDGGTAFPCMVDCTNDLPEYHTAGMTLRDYLIAKFEAAWIVALMERYQSMPVLIMKDAHNFAVQQADNFIAEKRRTERGDK